MKLPATLQARWNGTSPREQRLLLGALALVAVALVWWVALAPALATLRAADKQHQAVDAQLQQMQQLQTQAKALQAQPRMAFDDARRALETSIKPLGATAQMTVVGDRVTVALKAMSADNLAQWLAQVRLNARALPGEARLTRQRRRHLGWHLGADPARTLRLASVARSRSDSSQFARRGAGRGQGSCWGWWWRCCSMPPHAGSRQPCSRGAGPCAVSGAPRTVWNGSAQLALAGGTGSHDAAALPGRVSWRIMPSFSGLHVDLHADCCTQQPLRLSLLPQWGGARVLLADSLSQWPAQWLTGLGTPWNTVQAEGQLALSTQGLEVTWASGRMVLAGRAQLDAAQISSRLSTLKPMGSYRITVLGGATPSLQLETLDGSLQLSGTGQWVGAKFRFDGVASATPERLDALSNLLNIIGRRDGARAIIKVG